MKFETVTIANVECLACFTNNNECLSIKFVFATETGLQQTKALVPHRLEICHWADAVKSTHKQSAIASIEQWIKEGKLTPNSQNSAIIRYFDYAGSRAYINFASINCARAISSINLVDEYCKTCSLQSILAASGERYMSAGESKDFQERCARWQQKNRAYIEQKARDFALFWVSALGTLGSSGDATIDLMNAVVPKIERPRFEKIDVDKLYNAIYTWAITEFENAEIPFLFTDYRVQGELKELLERNFLSHLQNMFPIKTWMHINFDDIDRSALYE